MEKVVGMWKKEEMKLISHEKTLTWLLLAINLNAVSLDIKVLNAAVQ